jgi:hypothetical protein
VSSSSICLRPRHNLGSPLAPACSANSTERRDIERCEGLVARKELEPMPANFSLAPVHNRLLVDRLPRMGTWQAPSRIRRYAPLSGVAKYPAGARPSKCYLNVQPYQSHGPDRLLNLNASVSYQKDFRDPPHR